MNALVNFERKAICILLPKNASGYLKTILQQNYGFNIVRLNIENFIEFTTKSNNISEKHKQDEVQFIRKKGIVRYYEKALNKKGFLSKAQWDTFYKFTFVRNPYEKFVSNFLFFKEHKNKYNFQFQTLDDLINGFYIKNEIISDPIFSHGFITQYNHLLSSDNNITFDCIGKVETLDDDLKSILSYLKFEIKETETNKVNFTNKMGLDTYLSLNVLNFINTYFETDFKHFKYNVFNSLENLIEHFRHLDTMRGTAPNVVLEGSNLNIPIQSLIINLKSNIERKTSMIEKIKNTKLTNYTFVEAIDGKTELHNHKFKIIPNWIDPIDKEEITVGCIGCALSHYKCWKHVVDNKLDKAIILEDDTTFLDNFDEMINYIDQFDTRIYDLCYLNRIKLNDLYGLGEEIDINDTLVIPKYSYNASSYIITYSGALKLLNCNFLNCILPVDELLPIMYDEDYPFTIYSEYYKVYPKLRAIALRYDIANQESREVFPSSIVGSSKYIDL
jgi:glycosyl transferase, family 25